MQNEAGYQAQEIRLKVKWLMILRAAVVTVLLGSLVVLQVYQEREVLPAVYIIIIATYVLTIVYSIVFHRIKRHFIFAGVQVVGDVFLETGVVYATGGLDSAFSVTYLFTMFAAGFLLFRRGSFVVASFAGISYGAVVALHYYGFILSAPVREYSLSELYYNIFLMFFALFTVALLASSLSERLKVTREALAEKSMDFQELRALNESIVRSMADGMVTVGLDGRITAFNKAGEEITGRPLGEVRGRLFSEVFSWVGVETFFEDMEAAGRPLYRSELVYKRPDKVLVLGMTVSPLKNEKGEVTGILGIFQDLTPFKEMEEEIKRKDRLAAIGELSAGMAHEIRNPLASLSGSLQVLKSDLELSEEDGRLMDIALEEMDRLNGLLTEFLTYARPKAPAKEGCDLASIVRDTLELVANSKESREDVKLEAELPDAPVMLRADPGQLKQVILNLSLNALQSIPGPGTVRVMAGGDGEGKVRLEVEDDGVGIKREDIDKVFYPFYSTKEGGAGLGLAIVYRIIEEHGGVIKVDSAPGMGTRFTVTLPAEGKA